VNRSTTAMVAEDPPYIRHEKIYPREIGGRFATLRRLAVLALLGLYYALPWVDFRGRQAVLFDLPSRKFYLFGVVLWPQDFIFLTWLLVMAGLSLFFFTALAGRLWCGFACPQTVWTELFVWIERFVEGDRARQIKRDRGPWTADKIVRKTVKQTLWVALALWTGLTFVGFFSPIRTLVLQPFSGELAGWALFWTLFYGFATYGNAGFLREQVCKYMCPYARFQSAMFDRGSLVITYDSVRGEPRGPHARGVDPRTIGQGDCVDCTLCVQVCPTGIDIRNGLQYECIACAACVDACDSVMDRVARPRGLVRFTSLAALEGRPTRVLRPRILVYGGLLAGIALTGLVGLIMRPLVAVDVIRDRNVLYRSTPGGVENVYNLKILNKDERPHRFTVSVTGLPGLTLDDGGRPISVDGGEVRSVPLRVVAAGPSVSGNHPIRFSVADTAEPTRVATERSRFIAP